MDDEAFDPDAVLTGVLAIFGIIGLEIVEKWGYVRAETYKSPRIQILAYCLISVEGMTITGSFPPSSSVTGGSDSAAAATTLRPTSSEPMKVTWLIQADLVSVSASSGKQQTS